jgi:hypothetical protein
MIIWYDSIIIVCLHGMKVHKYSFIERSNVTKVVMNDVLIALNFTIHHKLLDTYSITSKSTACPSSLYLRRQSLI